MGLKIFLSVYDGIEVETRKSRTSFILFSLMPDLPSIRQIRDREDGSMCASCTTFLFNLLVSTN